MNNLRLSWFLVTLVFW